MKRVVRVGIVAVAVGPLFVSLDATPVRVSPVWAANVVPTACHGAFSDGTSINVANPAYLADVPGSQLFCDFHTFAWNQFLYLTSGTTPPFLSMAPWYNVLEANGSPPPAAHPGGSTARGGGQLGKGQGGRRGART